MSRTLLALMVPEAEPVVGEMRAQRDPSAKLGFGPHITLVYPFLDSGDIDDAVMRRASDIVARHAPQVFRLSEVSTFPSTVWLAPSPVDAIAALAADLERAFPERPVAGQAFAMYVPHVSAARNVRGDLDGLATKLRERLDRHGPLDCVCNEVAVMVRDAQGWRTLARMPLSSAG